ncbi:MAG: hypothetical protein Q8K60_08230 [Parachlamydiaceae bacterium]|nr:hypothetical protein [Parachlamydiaceae bacterium]
MSIYESLGPSSSSSSSSDEEIIRENITPNNPHIEKTAEKIITFIQTTLQKNHSNDSLKKPITFTIGIGLPNSQKGYCQAPLPEGDDLEKFKILDSSQQQIHLLNYSNELSKNVLKQLNDTLGLKGIFSTESKLKGPWTKSVENSYSNYKEINECNGNQCSNERYVQCINKVDCSDGIGAAFCCCFTISAVTGSIFLCIGSLVGCAIFKATDYCLNKQKRNFNHCQLVITYSQSKEDSFLL